LEKLHWTPYCGEEESFGGEGKSGLSGRVKVEEWGFGKGRQEEKK